MTFSGDPFRTLGLPPGASQDQVKRAYRQLAKRYHPDSAGESALPRFLAIQAAYDMLTGSTRAPGARTGRPARPGGAAGGSTGAARSGTGGPTDGSGPTGVPGAGGPASDDGPSGAGPSSRRPDGRTSQAEANRANATRDAYRARRARTAHGPGAGSSRGAGAAPGTAWAREGPPGRTTGAGPDSTGSNGTPPPDSDAAGGAASSDGTASATGGAASNPGRTGPGAAGHGRDGRRPRRTATLGSTSYDDAPHDPEPAWGGATWYGGSSGTYWTINPKEYADPRKHGPEYLARGRRFRAAAAASTNGTGADPADASWDDAPEPPWTADTTSPDAQPGPPPAPPAGPASAPPTESAGPRSEERSPSADPAANETARRPPQPTWTTGGFASSAGPGDRRTGFAAAGPGGPGGPAAPAAARFTFENDPDDDDVLVHPFDAPISQRVLLALIAWPPIGFAAGALIGNATGCDRYAATCSPEASALGWIVQPAIVALLLLLPFVARPAAIASIAVGVGAVIAATVLSIAGGAKDPTHAAQTILVAILVMAYAVGLIGALSGRIRLPRWLRQPI